MGKHSADSAANGGAAGGNVTDQDSGLERAAGSLAENMADQVPDGVDAGPQDTANEGPDARTETHASLSEGSNAREGDDHDATH